MKRKNQWFEEFRHSRNKSKSKLLTLLAGKRNKSNWSQGKVIPSQQNSEPKKKIRSHHHPFKLKIKHPINKVEENKKTVKAFPSWILSSSSIKQYFNMGWCQTIKRPSCLLHNFNNTWNATTKKQRKISALASHKSKYKHTIV